MGHFSKLINSYKDTVPITPAKAWDVLGSMEGLFDNLENTDKEMYWKVMRDLHVEMKGKHFDECFAVYQVGMMNHTKADGKICYGEIISSSEAEQIYERYKRSIKPDITKWDVYVALNAQYHDYDLLFTQWFKDKEIVKEKIIESAIVFWFKDEDSTSCKTWTYFNS